MLRRIWESSEILVANKMNCCFWLNVFCFSQLEKKMKSYYIYSWFIYTVYIRSWVLVLFV